MTKQAITKQAITEQAITKQVHFLKQSLFATMFSAIILLPSFIQTATAQEDGISEIVVLGSRTLSRSVLTTPSPIDVLSKEILDDTAQGETGRAIQNIAPSFNFPSTSIADGTDALKPATLRGLSPDQVLVLVNGRRRHKSALIHINTSVGRGTAGTDMNAIAPIFIGGIEILRDGASAQYGSDAIAGVINLKLPEITNWQFVSALGATSEGDGETIRAGISKGFEVGDGHIFWGLDYRNRGRTNRSGLSGILHYKAGVVPDAEFVGTAVTPFTSDGATCNATTSTGCDDRERTINRRNMIVGDAESEHYSTILSGGGDINGVRLDGYIHWSARDNHSTGFFRSPDDPNRNVVAIYSDGFLPQINTEISDLAYNFSVSGAINDWELQAAATYGKNTFDFFITNSLNASFGNNSPTSADSGGLAYDELAVHFDVTHRVGDVDIAFGAEFKTESFEIRAGEALSWANCNTPREKALVEANYPDRTFTCLGKAAGIQVFPGYRSAVPAGTNPTTEPAINGSALERDRDSTAIYVEASRDFDNGLVLDGALRWENHDGFGDTFSGKFALFYQVNDGYAIRSTISNGFRAPSLHQLYFNTTSTFFDANGQPNETLTASNDSALAKALGIPELKEETSANLGFGFVATPTDSTNITIDLYDIKIKDRITLSGQIGQNTVGLSPVAANILATRFVSRAQFFINAPDTTTRGIDLVANWAPEQYDGALRLKFAWNYTDTKVDGRFDPPGLLGTGDATGDASLRAALFNQRDVDVLERWQPKQRAAFTIDYDINDWTISNNLSSYGEYFATNSRGQQKFSATTIYNFRAHWQINETSRLSFIGDNIFDEYPEVNNRNFLTRAGTIDGIVDSPQGIFIYSRHTAPYGFNGRYIGIQINQEF